MKELLVKKVNLDSTNLNYPSLANELAELDWNAIDQSPWKQEFPVNPEAKFQIAYDSQSIILHYEITEEFVKAQYIRPNENIWEDSCVEFFISFDQGKTYYNAEFNVLGTGLIGYGSSDKENRNRLTAEDILKVNTFTQVKNINGIKTWNIILTYPFSLFAMTSEQLSGSSATANFYKCGDSLPNPHFVAWNNIDFPKPNFHLPEFFGKINFE